MILFKHKQFYFQTERNAFYTVVVKDRLFLYKNVIKFIITCFKKNFQKTNYLLTKKCHIFPFLYSLFIYR